MRFFFIIIAFFFELSACSQPAISKLLNEEEIQRPAPDSLEMNDFLFCNIGCEPLVDIEKWKTYLSHNLILDNISLDTIPAGSYTVLVQFAIGDNGKLNNVSILKNPGYDFDKRVIKVISDCRSIWKTSMCNIYKTINYRRQLIIFIVEKEDCDESLPTEFIL